MFNKVMKAFAVMSIVMAWVENATQDDVITVEEATDLVRQVAEAVGVDSHLEWKV